MLNKLAKKIEKKVSAMQMSAVSVLRSNKISLPVSCKGKRTDFSVYTNTLKGTVMCYHPSNSTAQCLILL